MDDNTFMNDFEHLIDRAKYFANKAEELCLLGREELKKEELEELKGLVNEARLMYLTVLIANTDALLAGEEIPSEVKKFRDMLEKLPDALEKIYEGYKILMEE